MNHSNMRYLKSSRISTYRRSMCSSALEFENHPSFCASEKASELFINRYGELGEICKYFDINTFRYVDIDNGISDRTTIGLARKINYHYSAANEFIAFGNVPYEIRRYEDKVELYIAVEFNGMPINLAIDKYYFSELAVCLLFNLGALVTSHRDDPFLNLPIYGLFSEKYSIFMCVYDFNYNTNYIDIIPVESPLFSESSAIQNLKEKLFIENFQKNYEINQFCSSCSNRFDCKGILANVGKYKTDKRYILIDASSISDLKLPNLEIDLLRTKEEKSALELYESILESRIFSLLENKEISPNDLELLKIKHNPGRLNWIETIDEHADELERENPAIIKKTLITPTQALKLGIDQQIIDGLSEKIPGSKKLISKD